MRILTFLIAIVIGLPSLTWAYDVLVLVSKRDPMYEEALKGFRQVRRFSERSIVLSDYSEVDLTRLVKEDHPKVILAVGDKALSMAKRSRQIPVVSLMALSINRGGSLPMATGVDLFTRPDLIFQLFLQLKATQVGVLFDPKKSGAYLKKAQFVADRVGVELEKKAIVSDKDAISLLTQLSGVADAIWMIPDVTAVNGRTIEAYFLISQGQNIPLVSFDRSHLGYGAALAVEPDRQEMGRQAGEMVEALLDGASIADLPPTSPRKYFIKTNPSVLKRLRIPNDSIERLQGFDRE